MKEPTNAARRQLLLQSGGAAVAALSASIGALATRVAHASGAATSALQASPYGPTAPVKDLSTGLALIELPDGFSCRSHGWAGDVMSDGLVTPHAHDGMGIVRSRKTAKGDELVLVRNHELAGASQPGAVLGAAAQGVAKYDTGQTSGQFMAGGTTTVVWRDGGWADSYASLGGLRSPCAGGSTAWGSWLANEEVRSPDLSSTGKRHGYVFEVPADTSQKPASVEPIVAMGRMAHEACAFDPATGYWYLTEDNYNANTLYRFLPSKVQGGLGTLHAGGRLQGLAVRGRRNADLRDPKLHEEWLCEWVDVAQPDADSGPLADAVASNIVASGPYLQAHASGAAVFGGTEGCWVAGGRVWFTDKLVTMLPPRAGRIWTLDLASMSLKAVFVSHSVQVGNSPDNLCVSPKGGVLFCEDGTVGGPGDTLQGVEQQLKVLHPNGRSSVFAKHYFNFTRQQLDAVGKTNATSGDLRRTEWAGATFSPDGQVLFVNLYSPGMTLAITGPWQKGPL